MRAVSIIVGVVAGFVAFVVGFSILAIAGAPLHLIIQALLLVVAVVVGGYVARRVDARENRVDGTRLLRPGR